MLQFIPGFRSKKIWKMIIASIYYLICFSMVTKGLGYMLGPLSMPFLFFNGAGLIKRKNKSAVIPFVVSLVIFFVAIAITPSDNDTGRSTTNTSKSTVEQEYKDSDKQVVQSDKVNSDIKTEGTKTPNQSTEQVNENKNSSKISGSGTTEQTSSPGADKQAVQVNTNTKQPTGNLKVHFIDVGQADAILIQAPTGESMLIDAGNNADSNLVVSYIKQQGIKRLDYVVGTHPHEDHIGGLDAVINAYDVGKVLMPRKDATTKTFEDVLLAIKNKGLKVTSPDVGTVYKLGDAIVTILAPAKASYDDANDYSIVARLNYGDKKFLFMGDAEMDSERDILGVGMNIVTDVLKVGHHGSDSSTSKAFLDNIGAKYAVISVGKDNSYGHPHKEVLGRLAAANIKVYRTDEVGTIIATTDGKTITFDKKTSAIKENAPPVTQVTPVPKVEETKAPESSVANSIKIVSVDLQGEIVTIKNFSDKDINMAGWKLVSVEGNQVYNFSTGYVIKAGQSVTIASGDANADIKWTSKNIWNNKGDTGQLYDGKGNLVSEK